MILSSNIECNNCAEECKKYYCNVCEIDVCNICNYECDNEKHKNKFLKDNNLKSEWDGLSFSEYKEGEEFYFKETFPGKLYLSGQDKSKVIQFMKLCEELGIV